MLYETQLTADWYITHGGEHHDQRSAARKRYIANHSAAHPKSTPYKDIRTCVREAEALGMSYGNYVAAGLDQVEWDGHGRDADEQTA